MSIIRIVGGVNGLSRYPELMECIGQYVVRYEPRFAKLGQQWLWTSPNIEEALEFPNLSDAHEFLMQSIGTRWDGQPDRPITVFHVQIGAK
jgi:hypothetical protein